MSAALITGGSRGIGAAVVRELAAAGYDVALGYLSREDAADAVATDAGATGAIVKRVRGDLAEDGAPVRLVADAAAAVGPLDALVVNAAIWIRGSILDVSAEDYDRAFTVNLRSAYFLIQAFARHVVERDGRGRIVVITSRAARRPRGGSSTYSISKAAQAALVRAAAIELAPHGITVNEVAPGPTETDMNRGLRCDPDTSASLSAPIVLGRFGRPADVAHSVRFLLSDGAEFITGATLAVDGGASLG